MDKAGSVLRDFYREDGRGFVIGLDDSRRRCPCALRGRHETVSIIGLAPYVYYTPQGIKGVDPDIIDILGEKLARTF